MHFAMMRKNAAVHQVELSQCGMPVSYRENVQNGSERRRL